ncbi:MAG: hypothetical protein ACOYMN_04195 [Roseimicrobium sp.]
MQILRKITLAIIATVVATTLSSCNTVGGNQTGVLQVPIDFRPSLF